MIMSGLCRARVSFLSARRLYCTPAGKIRPSWNLILNLNPAFRNKSAAISKIEMKLILARSTSMSAGNPQRASSWSAARISYRVSTFMTQPRPHIGSLSQLCGNCAFVFATVSFMNTDMLTLRCLAITSTSLMLAFNYYRPQPLWIPIRWNLLILSINAVMVSSLLYQQYKAERMGEEMEALFVRGRFGERGFSKVQFMKFMEAAAKVQLDQNDVIAKEGQPMSHLYYVLEGNVTVTCAKDGRTLATVTPHHFIGELAFLLFSMNHHASTNITTTVSTTASNFKQSKPNSTHEPSKLQPEQTQSNCPIRASANVIAGNNRPASKNEHDNTTHKVTLMKWNSLELSQIFTLDRELSNAFSAYCNHDLREKLLLANSTGGSTHDSSSSSNSPPIVTVDPNIGAIHTVNVIASENNTTKTFNAAKPSKIPTDATSSIIHTKSTSITPKDDTIPSPILIKLPRSP